MPIASYKPEADKPIPEDLSSIQPKNYKNIVIDNSQIPNSELVGYISGAPWTVNYYSQILGENSEIQDLDINLPGTLQQYRKINNLELRLSDPLSTNQNPDNNIITITGSGLLYPFLIPNVSDVFVASTITSEYTLFRVTNVRKLSFNRFSTYSIEFDTVGFLDIENPRYIDLENKVSQTYYFNKDRLVEGSDPLIIENDYNNLLSLKNIYNRLINFYFSSFFRRENSTIIIPGQDYVIYDDFITKYILKLLDSIDCDIIRNVRIINTDNDQCLLQDQFWSIMVKRDFNLLSICNKDMGLVYTKQFQMLPVIHSIRYSGIYMVVYPNTVDNSININSITNNKTTTNSYNLQNTSKIHSTDIYFNDTNQNTLLPNIYPVLYDNNYVLSNNFYNDTNNKSLLEKTTMDYIKRNMLNVSDIITLANDYLNWPRLEQFYYIPILLTLIKTANKGMY